MSSQQIVTLFLGIAAVLLLANVFGTVARRLGQPPVIGEIIAGIAVGPTILHGHIANSLFPTDIRPELTALANIGLAFFMFIVGLDLAYAVLRDRKALPASVSLLSTALPFTLGCGLAVYLYHAHGHGRHEAGFILFVGASMSVTAFPVLARILKDRRMDDSPIGNVALASAAISDVLAWSLLAAAVTVGGGPDQWRILLAPVYVAVLFLVVRPVLRRIAARADDTQPTSAGLLSTVSIGLLLSCLATEWLGMHFIFGAFLFGAIMPRGAGSGLRTRIARMVEPVTTVVLLPIFFVVAGFKVDLSRISLGQLGDLGLILVVAIVGKTVGGYAGARVNHVPRNDAAVLGILMNARGLTELIILSVGLQLGFLDGSLYSLMVVMAVATTAMTGPLLNLCAPTVEADPVERLEITETYTAALPR